MAHLLDCVAVRIAPLPVAPAAPKITSAPCAIIRCAACAPRFGSTKVPGRFSSRWEPVKAGSVPCLKAIRCCSGVSRLKPSQVAQTQNQTGFVDPSLLNQLKITSHDIQDISITLKDNISSISEQLGIPKAEPKTYFEVLQSANAQLGKLSLDLEQKKMALERRTIELSSLNQMSSNLQASMKKIDQSLLQVKQAEEALNLAAVSFKTGAITNLDLLDAETALEESRVNLLRARIEYAINLVRLNISVGNSIQ